MTENSKQKQSRRAALATFGISALAVGATASPVNGAAEAALSKADVQFFPSLGALQADSRLKVGTYATTLGYYLPGDGGSGLYEIVATSDAYASVPLTNRLFAKLIAPGQVNYKLFGAKCDGNYDDGIAIKAAHQFANANRIPVVNLSGEYWLKDTKQIPIQTNTQWGNSIFHIDESRNSPKETHFEVLPDAPAVEIQLSTEEKRSLIEKLKPGSRLLPELAPYRNSFVVIKDENDRIGRRYGADYNPKGWAREDFFYVEEHGLIIGDLAWAFQDYTSLTAYPCSEGYLTVEGGTFLLSGDNPGLLGGSYHQGGITTRRSRTIIRNQWVGLEKGKTDLSLTPRSGFYTFSHVYDILLENIRLVPWEKDRKGTDRDLKAGTYGIGGSRVFCGTFRNITAEGSPEHWGVFGTNLYKNFRIESCRLNRVDVHFHGWNITIKDSEIGQKGLTLTGGGQLLIENTRVFNNVFLNFRADYGAKWDGPIRVINSQAVIQNSSNSALLSMVPGKFDYKYPVVLGHEILVSDFTFVSQPDWEKANYQLIRLPAFSSSEEGGRIVFPRRVTFSRIAVQGRKKGVHLFDLPDLSSFLVPHAKGGLRNGLLTTNSTLRFDQIMLDDTTQSVNLRLNRIGEYLDEYSLYPAIIVTDCQGLHTEVNDTAADFKVIDSTIRQFTAGKNSDFEGRILFDNCRFQGASGAEQTHQLFQIKGKTGVSFNQCEINLPLNSDGSIAPAQLERIAFLSINQSLRHNHTGTRLGNDVLSYLSEKGIRIRKEFIAKLKSHHELEEEY
jgi:hypothetical protein